MSGETAQILTVGQLVECLRMFPADARVVAYYDCRTAAGDVVKVEIGPDPADNHQSVVLIVD
jgi:hypothetical protein